MTLKVSMCESYKYYKFSSTNHKRSLYNCSCGRHTFAKCRLPNSVAAAAAAAAVAAAAAAVAATATAAVPATTAAAAAEPATVYCRGCCHYHRYSNNDCMWIHVYRMQSVKREYTNTWHT